MKIINASSLQKTVKKTKKKCHRLGENNYKNINLIRVISRVYKEVI